MPDSRPSRLFTHLFVPLLVVGCLAAGVFVGFVVGQKAASKREGPTAPTPFAADQRTNVHTVTLAPRPLRELVVLPCSVEPYQQISLASETSGQVHAVGAEEGESVKSGQMVVACDIRTLEARRAETAASQRRAESTLTRLKALGEFALDDELDQAEADLAVREAALRLAQIELDKATLRSPIDGILDQRLVDVGEYVVPGQTVAHIVDITQVKAVLALPEIHVPFVRTGKPIEVRFPYLNGAVAPLTGPVVYQATVANSASRTYRTEIALDNPDGLVRPGMIGKVYLVRRELEDAISVPVLAIIVKEGRRLCAVEQDGVAHLRDVALGLDDGLFVQVVAGLQAGDRLIVEGHRELAEGDSVRVMGEITPEQLEMKMRSAPGAPTAPSTQEVTTAP